ncbi:MAG: ABC transporter ATP-binding protein [bacterium]|nr:ABC transporter ATP-binding protein [bacterium]
MIEVENLSKRYAANLAVDNLSFEAKPGEILGLLGPNGAGKTTTMRMLTGFLPPTSGTARIAGFDVMTDSIEVRKQVGYMPERIPIYPDMTVEGYVGFWAKLRGVRQARRRVQDVLQQVQLYDRRKSLVRNLSKGMRQRLGLAQALVHEPKVIILDEPTIGIDPQQVIEVRESVRQLGENHTVLFSTHILSEAEQVCDRVAIIHKGRMMALGNPAELRQQLHPDASIFVQIGGVSTTSEARKLLEKIPGVQRVEANGTGYIVQAQLNVDVRPYISDRVVKAGYTLLEMRPVAMTLEDIFLEIVGR